MLVVDHIDRGHDIRVVQHGSPPGQMRVHGREDILAAACGWTGPSRRPWRRCGSARRQIARCARGPLGEHDHGERALHNGLADLHDADVQLGQQRADLGDDADPVRADDGDNGFHSGFLLCSDMEKGAGWPLFSSVGSEFGVLGQPALQLADGNADLLHGVALADGDGSCRPGSCRRRRSRSRR